LLAFSCTRHYMNGMGQPKTKDHKPQLSVRSSFASARASKLAKLTGMTITQIVEDALRAYQPPARIVPGGLVEKGGLLVKPKGETGITQPQVDAELEEIRSGAR
jgi:hypothetical protein